MLHPDGGQLSQGAPAIGQRVAAREDRRDVPAGRKLQPDEGHDGPTRGKHRADHARGAQILWSVPERGLRQPEQGDGAAGRCAGGRRHRGSAASAAAGDAAV